MDQQDISDLEKAYHLINNGYVQTDPFELAEMLKEVRLREEKKRRDDLRSKVD